MNLNEATNYYLGSPLLVERNDAMTPAVAYANKVVKKLKIVDEFDIKRYKDQNAIELIGITPTTVIITMESGRGRSGGFHSKEKCVLIPLLTEAQMSRYIDDGEEEKVANMLWDMVLLRYNSQKDFINTLTHEYVHFYDDALSSGKNVSDEHRIDLAGIGSFIGMDYSFKKEYEKLYYNHNAEMNAYFTAFYKSLPKSDRSKGFVSVKNKMKREEWFKSLTDENKERIYKRLYQTINNMDVM